jgi:hypothetical protein
MRLRVTLAAVVALTVAASACARDPLYTLARLAERAASWGASIQFAEELAAGGLVPRGYLDDLMSAASHELSTLAGQIDELQGVDDRTKSNALTSCLGLAAIAGEAARIHGSPMQSSIRELELQLRDAAQRARGAGRSR